MGERKEVGEVGGTIKGREKGGKMEGEENSGTLHTILGCSLVGREL